MDNSRLFLYAALAFVGLLIWEQWKADYGPKPEPVAVDKTDPSMRLKLNRVSSIVIFRNYPICRSLLLNRIMLRQKAAN